MSDKPVDIAAIEARVARNLGRIMFAARWLMAPIYIGLLFALALVALKFIQKLVIAVPTVFSLTNNDVILVALGLVDLSLVANLVVIVIFAGWANFIGPLLSGSARRDANWMRNLDFGAVKLKLIGSIAAIAAVQLLEAFVHVSDIDKKDVAWQLAILLGIGVTGVLLAVMDRLSEHK